MVILCMKRGSSRSRQGSSRPDYLRAYSMCGVLFRSRGWRAQQRPACGFFLFSCKVGGQSVISARSPSARGNLGVQCTWLVESTTNARDPINRSIQGEAGKAQSHGALWLGPGREPPIGEGRRRIRMDDAPRSIPRASFARPTTC